MSHDFAVITADFDAVADAPESCDAMYADPGGLLSTWPVAPSTHDVVSTTRWSQWDPTIHNSMTMTMDGETAMSKLQRRQVSDPVGRAEVAVPIHRDPPPATRAGRTSPGVTRRGTRWGRR